MAIVSFKERVNAPVTNIFGVMTDIANAPNHISGIKNVNMVSEGPVGVGTRWKETRIMFGKESTEEMWITDFVENEKYVVEAESCGANYKTTFKFLSVDNYTTDVSMEMNVTPLTFAAKLMSPISFFMKGSIVKAVKQDLHDACAVCKERYDEESHSSVKY